MTPHEHKVISDLRGTYTQATGETLYKLAKLFNGPTNKSCFCKQPNITRYIDSFYAWYDANYPITTNE